MKKSFLFLSLLFSLFSCSNQEQFVEQVSQKDSNFKKFEIFGDVHNSVLRHVSSNFNDTQARYGDASHALDYVVSIQKECVNNLSISSNAKEILCQGFDNYKELVKTDYLMSYIIPIESRSDDGEEFTTEDVRNLIEEAYECGGIDLFEYNTFMELIDCVIQNANGTLSNDSFQTKVNELIAKWEDYYKDIDFSNLIISEQTSTEESGLEPVDFQNGALGGVVLSISNSSLEYWNEESEDSRAIPVFVGADIAGAVICAASSCVGSYAISGTINWSGVAWSAASGAICGSTGVVGKVGRWISKLF